MTDTRAKARSAEAAEGPTPGAGARLHAAAPVNDRTKDEGRDRARAVPTKERRPRAAPR